MLGPRKIDRLEVGLARIRDSGEGSVCDPRAEREIDSGHKWVPGQDCGEVLGAKRLQGPAVFGFYGVEGFGD